MFGAWIMTLLSIAYVAVAGYFTLIPTDDIISNSQLSRFTYELTQFIPIILVLLIAGIFYLWGQREQRQRKVIASEEIAVNRQEEEERLIR